MELRDLRCALALRDHGHFGRAAQALGIDRPRLRQQIKALEADLGFDLFHRADGAVRPTPAGRVFLRRVRHALRHLDQAAVEAAEAGRGDAGTLSVGFGGAALAAILPEAVAAFREHYPLVRLELVEAPAAEQVAQVLAGHLDAGLVCGPPPAAAREQLACVPIAHDRLLAAVPDPGTAGAAGAGAGHETDRHGEAGRHAARGPLPLAALAKRPLILTSRNAEPAVAEAALAMCRTAGFEPPGVIEASGLHAMLGLVACGLGVGVGPESMRRLRHDGVALRELSPPGPVLAVHLIHRAGDPAPLLHNFRRIAQIVGR
ncbi:LysR family transcriptional regulator [Microbispora sp. RL4-1S]|uniref:LysR family transcriptional regulator n=1 Tax=Microbispora oryzae TaxID=2806554 RepID=A0A941AIK3_9ACTN|nr:LysR family transcriptional regulator [Microbispora oryzae]MBP2703962.1 LysR family transcriptional regulator [Microbispora oryzae]